MNNLIPFSFEGAAVRVNQIDGEPWFVAADVCAVLEHGNPRQVVSRLDDDEKGVQIVDTPGGPQEVTAINESGLYSLILTSRKPAAKRFKKWVTSEVLPSIRKTGSFGAPQLDLTNPDHLIGLLTTYANDKRELLATVAEQAPKVEAFDRIANADGMMNMTNAAKALQVQPRTLIQWLHANSWIYRHAGGDWTAYQDKIKSGHLTHKTNTVQRQDGSDKEVWAVRVTAKGLAKLAIAVPGAQVAA